MLHLIRTLNMSTQTVSNMTSVQLEEQFRCCICLEIYTDPVSIPCGHNFCLDCIEDYWDTKVQCECPLCKEIFPRRPELRINHAFADIIEFLKRSLFPTAKEQLTDPATFPTSHFCRHHNKPLTMFCKNDRTPVCMKCTEREHKHHKTVPLMKESNRIKTNVKATKAEIQKMIQVRQTKMEEIEKSLDQSKNITEREIQNSYQVCDQLITTIKKHQLELVEELKQTQVETVKRAKELREELKQEINELQKRNDELQHLELTVNPVHVLQSFPSLSRLPSTREWSKVAVHSDNCMGRVRKAISKFMDVCQEIENKLYAEEADKMNQYAADVTLDPDTASGWLVLSSDGKKVGCQKKMTPRPHNPQRFDSCVCVLGKQRFTSGRFYWVVEVGDKTDWDLGVARQSINRKGSIVVRPDSGYWAICRRKGGNLSACTRPTITLHLQETPKKVGIFVDYEEGSVSFYDAQAKTHIYTYSRCTFTEPLYPYFNPCVQENGKNMAPLVICPLEGRVREGQDIIIQ